MKAIFRTVFILFLFISSSFAEEISVPAELDSKEDKVSYSVGFQIGDDLRQQDLDLDPNAFLKGVADALAEAMPRLNPEEMHTTLLALKKKIVAQKKAELVDRKIEQRKRKEMYQAEERAFLAENKKRDGVITLPNGLHYMVIREGTGQVPGPNDSVTIQCRGTLLDGTEFYNTYRENKPEEYRVDGVIAGWQEALQLMKEGAKWRLFIPADLAYGERGPLADRAVIFDLELISVRNSE